MSEEKVVLKVKDIHKADFRDFHEWLKCERYREIIRNQNNVKGTYEIPHKMSVR